MSPEIKALIAIGIYFTGFLISFVFLSIYGKKIMGFNYDERKDYDDYQSNAGACVGWSTAWFLWMSLFLLGYIGGHLKKLSLAISKRYEQ